MGETDIDELIKTFDKDSNCVFDKVGWRWEAVSS
jgi:hypothetical protein